MGILILSNVKKLFSFMQQSERRKKDDKVFKVYDPGGR